MPMTPAQANPGGRIGPYRLLRRIGRGGMAEVFEAVRADGMLPRSVALKVIRCAWGDAEDDPTIAQRFLAERQILGTLNHPNIARLLDGGTDDSGAPYVVLEYIEGLTLDRYLKDQTPDRSTRLRLFLELCEAVQYAHRHLIVHRDLKPTNVMITEDGRLKLLDFGIAKLLRPEFWRGVEVALTGPSERMATPEYAAPEQLRGEMITTASDIYALGVVLYYFLTGATPFHFSGKSWAEVEYALCTAAPEPLPRGEPADLRAIVALALRKDPAARYQSVGHLADDVRRFLDGRPVRARRGEWIYPATLWLRRNAAVASLAAGLIGVLGWSAVTQTRQAGRLKEERDTAAAVTAFMTSLLGAADPNGPRARTAQEVLNDGAHQLTTGKAQLPPRVSAAVAEKLGDVYRQLALYEQAEPLARRALNEYSQLEGPDSNEAARNMIRLADLLRERHKYAEAERLARRALAAHRQNFGQTSWEVADALNITGVLCNLQGKPQEAEAAHREAVRIRRIVIAPDSDQLTFLALSLSNLGNAMRESRPAEAETYFREALAIRRRFWGQQHPRVASSMMQLGSAILAGRHDAAAALALTTEAAAILRKSLPAGHPDIARGLEQHGNVLRAAGKLDEAEAVLRETLVIRRKTHGADSPEAATAAVQLAKVLKQAGRSAEATPLLRTAVEAYRQKLAPEHPLLRKALEELNGIDPLARK